RTVERAPSSSPRITLAKRPYSNSLLALFPRLIFLKPGNRCVGQCVSAVRGVGGLSPGRQQHSREGLVTRAIMAVEADAAGCDACVEAQEQTIPDRQERRVIAVRLRFEARVMHEVHSGRRDEECERAIERRRQSDVRMLED